MISIRRFLSACLFLLSLTAMGQTVNRVEYFWDTDPGRGHGTRITGYTASANVTINTSISTSNLTSGIHMLGLRGRSSRGIWSPTAWQRVVVGNEISRIEYFFDNDPGYDSGRAYTNYTPGNVVTITNASLNATGVSDGFHQLGLRTRAATDGMWSPTYWQQVLVNSRGVTQIEYFYDTDPGYGNGRAYTAFTPSTLVSINNGSLNATGVGNGFHTLGIRAKGGGNGMWSPTYWQQVLVNNAGISSIEYFWDDTDPGLGQATAITGFTPAPLVNITKQISTTGLSTGVHRLAIRARSGNGLWSPTYFHTVFVGQGADYAEYYWDIDPGYGQGAAIPFASDTVVMIDLNNIAVPTTYGLHILYLRAKAGTMWSPTYTQSYCIGPEPHFSLMLDNNEVCQNEQFIILDESQGASSLTHYTWDMQSDGVVDDTTRGDWVYSYSQAGVYTITMGITNSTTCQNTCTQEIVVRHTAAPTISISRSANNVCAGTEITFTANVGNVLPTYNPVIRWYRNGNPIAGAIGSTLKLSDLANNDVIRASVKVTNPCASNDSAMSGTLTMRIYPMPDVTMEGPSVITNTESAFMLINRFVTSPGGGTYRINGNTATLFNPRNNSLGEYEISYSYTNSNGCTKTVIDTFRLVSTDQYTITALPDNATHGTVTGGGTYTGGSTCTLIAIPAAGYRFTGWTSNGNTVSLDSVYSFYVNSNQTLTANFVYEIQCGIAIADLPYTDNFDSYTTNTTPKTGVEPPCWTLAHQDVSMTDDYKPMVYYGNAHSGNYSLILNKRGIYAMPRLEMSVSTLQMQFYVKQTAAKYQLQVGVMSDLSNASTFVPVTTINNSSTTASVLQTVDFSSYTGTGRYIAFRNVLASGSTGDYSCNYIDDITLSMLTTYTITASANPSAGGTVTGAGTYASGSTCTLTATPSTGYQFVNWTSGSTVVSNNATYSFTVNNNRTLTANFVQTYTIAATANPTVGGTITGVGTYTNGSSCTLTATPATGYRFVNWTSGSSVVSNNATYTFTVTSNRTLTANFAEDVTCGISIADLPYTDNFDSYTNSTTAKTGVEPTCWTLAHQDVTMSAEYKPMIYYASANAHSGNYSLILNKRGIYAMPEFEGDVSTLQLSMYLKQSATKYQLQVGVMSSLSNASSFVPVATINNSSTGIEYVEVDFSSYTGSGRYIAFRNILAAGNSGDYSCNYIDDLTLDVRPQQCGIAIADLPYTDNFDSYTNSTNAKTGVEPTCWTLAHQDVAMTDEYKPMIYYASSNAHSGNYSLLLNKRGIYAMPEFDGDVSTLQLSMYVKQGQAKYQLQVGVMSDLSNASTFVPVATINNSSTTASVLSTVSFASYTGNGKYIAFRNILSTGTSGDYSCNYIDDITLSQIISYTVTATANPTTGGTVTGAGSYASGSTCTLRAIPNANYTFTNWTVGNSVVSTSATYTFTVTANRTLTANFTYTPPSYTITASANPVTGGTVTGAGSYVSGSTCTLTATPSTGYTFSNWTSGSTVVSTNATYTFTVTANRTLTANFTPVANCGFSVEDLPYTDNFDHYTNSTTAKTGVEPTCWTLAHQDVTIAAEYKPMIYYASANAHSGSYSLILNKRGIYAMPEFDGDVSTLQMSMYLKQSATKYQLQVGVMSNLSNASSFVPVATINNSSTSVEYVEVDFSSYTGSGRYIAFRNILASGTSGDYSCNYIDDLTIDVRPQQCSITIADLPYIDDFDGYTTSTTAKTGVEPTCWSLVHQDVSMTDAYKPMIYYSPSYAHSGNYSLILNKRGIYAMPYVDADVSSLVMYIAVKQSQTKYQLQVGVMSDLNDINTFESMGTIDNSSTDYEFYLVDFSDYTGNGHYIAFHNILAPGNSGDFSCNYIDNLVLTQPETYTVTATANPTTGGAVTGAGSFISGTTCTLTATPNDNYTFTNWTDGDSVVSTSATYSFSVTSNRTLVANFTPTVTCGISVADLPYTDNFDTYTTSTTAKTGVEPTCWTLAHQDVSMTAEYKPMIYYASSNAHSGNYSLILNKRGIYAMPEFEGDVSTLLLSMYVKQGQAKYQLQVGVMSDLTNASTFVPVATINNTSTTASVLSTVSFASYTGNGHYIAFRNVLPSGTSGDYSCNYIDDITLSQIVSYTITAIANPTAGGTVTGAGTFTNGSSCTLTATPASGYEFTNWTSGNTVVSTNATYTFTVTSNRTLTANFTPVATCGITVADLPYTDNFESYTSSTTAKTGVEPTCWILAHQDVTMTDEYKPMVYYASSNAHSGSYSLLLNKRGIYAMPYFDGDVNTLQLSMYVKQGQAKYQLQVGVMSDLNNASTFVPVATINNSSTTASVLSTVDFSTYTGSGHYIAFRNILSSGQSGDYSCNYIDDITLTQIASYTITATANPAAGGTVTGAGNYTNGSTCTLTATPNTGYTFTNWTIGDAVVSTNATYSFTVTSNLTLMANFTHSTVCGINVSDLPYTENFDNYTTSTTASTGVQPPCWTLAYQEVSMTNEYKPMIYYSALNAHSGNYSLILNKRCIYAMPEFNGNVNELVMGFYVLQTRASYSLTVGVMDDLSDPSTYTPVASFNNSSTSDYVYREVDFSNYEGEGRYIVFRNINSAISDYSVNYIDDITLYRTTPACEISINDLPYTDNFDTYTTSTNAKTGVEPTCWMLAYQEVSMTDEYKPMIYYSASNAHSGNYSLILNKRGVYAMPAYSGDISTLQMSFYLKQTMSSYELTVGVMEDLEDLETFEPVISFNNSTTNYVQRVVDFSNYSGTGHYIVFRNTNSAISDYSVNYIDDLVLEPRSSSCSIRMTDLPYTDNFDTYTTSTTAKTGVEPDCWTLAHQDVAMTADYMPMIYYNASNAHSGSYSLILNKRGIYAMPAYEGSVSTLLLQFYVKQTAVKNQLQVGVMSDLSDASTFVVVATIDNTSYTAYEYKTVSFSSYTGSGHYIAFRNVLASGYTGDYSLNYIDDLTLRLAGSASGMAEEDGGTKSGDGTYEMPPHHELSLYPNPTTGRVTVEADEEVLRVDVYDYTGRRVATFENQATIDLGRLATGIYTLRMTLPERIEVRRVVKQ